MTLIKGLILSGGAGTRLRPFTHTSAKQLVPVANKPVIFYGIEALVNAKITDIGIIIAPHTGQEIKDVVGDGSKFGANITYIMQEEAKGLAHAVLTAEEFIGDSDFVMYLGDNILKDGINDLVIQFDLNMPDAMVLLTEVSDPSSYGIAELEGGSIKGLEEKPANPKSNLALVGVYIFTNKIFDAAKNLKPSARGELEITEAIQWLIDNNKNVIFSLVSGWWKDTGSVDEMLQANRLVLSSVEKNIVGQEENCCIEGEVVIEEGAIVRNSTIRGPAIIGSGSKINNCYIGPYTAIDQNVKIFNTDIEHSIVLSGSIIQRVPQRIDSSIIGKNTIVCKKENGPKTISLALGENSKVEIL